MDLSTLPDVQRREPIPFRDFAIKEPIDEPALLFGAATWTLEEAANLLATFRAETRYKDGSDRVAIFQSSWDQIHTALDKTIKSYEVTQKSFLEHIDDWSMEAGSSQITYYGTTVYPDKFVEWAREVSLDVPDDFYDKLMRAQKRHISRRKTDEGESLTVKEKRELGTLRREKETFDLAIKATVRAVQYCIKEERRVKRSELFDLMCSGDDSISKESFERILPLLPPEYRKGPGAPSSDKIGDPNESEI